MLSVRDVNPGYIIGADADGSPTLLPVQGSASKHPAKLSLDERSEILSEVRKQMDKKDQRSWECRHTSLFW